MAGRGELMALGLPAGQAFLLGTNAVTGLSGAGTSSQANATALNDVTCAFFSTVAANSGARLPTAEGNGVVAIYNGGASPLLVYPATGEQINQGTATTGSFSVTNAKSALFVPSTKGWVAILSA